MGNHLLADAGGWGGCAVEVASLPMHSCRPCQRRVQGALRHLSLIQPQAAHAAAERQPGRSRAAGHAG